MSVLDSSEFLGHATLPSRLRDEIESVGWRRTMDQGAMRNRGAGEAQGGQGYRPAGCLRNWSRNNAAVSRNSTSAGRMSRRSM